MDPVKGGRKRKGAGKGGAGRAVPVEPVAPEGSAEYWTAQQAAQRLGVKRETLYAYASRGLLHSERGPHGPARRYLRADVERLHARNQGRREDRPAGGLLLAQGEPILDSAISWIGEAGPFYRGHSAVSLARMGRSFEAVAELLWAAPLRPDEPRWSGEPQGMDELVDL